MTENERILLLEYKDTLRAVELQDMTQELKETNKKLDELLTLRNKGVGAFWLASALLGSGIVGSAVLIIDWLKGVHI